MIRIKKGKIEIIEKILEKNKKCNNAMYEIDMFIEEQKHKGIIILENRFEEEEKEELKNQIENIEIFEVEYKEETIIFDCDRIEHLHITPNFYVNKYIMKRLRSKVYGNYYGIFILDKNELDIKCSHDIKKYEYPLC